ncbi:MAG: chorismate mutase [Candidatus Limnocylindria bacterium]
MATRGIRGATTVERNDRDEILRVTRELLEVMVRLNGLRPDDVAYVWFTVTPDLDAEFPAFAARELGWTEVPLMCGREIAVPGALAGCIRVLIAWNSERSQREVRHAFLHRAKELRPAWAVEV